jgi:hypothetical protein
MSSSKQGIQAIACHPGLLQTFAISPPDTTDGTLIGKIFFFKVIKNVTCGCGTPVPHHRCRQYRQGKLMQRHVGRNKIP